MSVCLTHLLVSGQEHVHTVTFLKVTWDHNAGALYVACTILQALKEKIKMTSLHSRQKCKETVTKLLTKDSWLLDFNLNYKGEVYIVL